MNSSNLGKNYIQCVVANDTLLLYVIYTVSKEKKTTLQCIYTSKLMKQNRTDVFPTPSQRQRTTK